MIDEGQAESLRILVHAIDWRVVVRVDFAGSAVAIDQIQHAVADSLDHGRIHCLAARLVVDRLAAIGDDFRADLVGRLGDANGETASAGSMRFGEIGGK